MTISPCAMLMTPITPKVMARPMAASRSTEPSESPYQAFCSALQMARLFSMDAMASLAAFATAGGAVAGSAAEERKRILIPPLADHANGIELVLLGCIVEIENDRGACLDQRLLHLRIGFLGDRLFERGQRIRILGSQYGLRRFQALCRIRRHQGQAAERRLDNAPQTVVQPDRREIGWAAARRRLGLFPHR